MMKVDHSHFGFIYIKKILLCKEGSFGVNRSFNFSFLILFIYQFGIKASVCNDVK